MPILVQLRADSHEPVSQGTLRGDSAVTSGPTHGAGMHMAPGVRQRREHSGFWEHGELGTHWTDSLGESSLRPRPCTFWFQNPLRSSDLCLPDCSSDPGLFLLSAPAVAC